MNSCPECATGPLDGELVCPKCGTLIWRDRLRELHEESRQAEATGDWERCLRALAACHALLPPGTRQHDQIGREIQRISHCYNNPPPAPSLAWLEEPAAGGLRQASWPVAAGRAMACVFKGLSKPRTLISLVLWTISLSVLMGWREALIFGLMIYVHEMGHLVLIQYYGYNFAWPVFVPFLGAFVLQGRQSARAHENLSISLAGPLAGAALSFAILALNKALPLPPLLLRLTHLNLLINFFNLIPVWQLDGGRMARNLPRGYLVAMPALLLLVAVACRNGYTLIMALSWAAGVLINWNTPERTRAGESTRSWQVHALAALTLVLLIAASLALDGTRLAAPAIAATTQ